MRLRRLSVEGRVKKVLTDEERVRHRAIRTQIEQEKPALIAHGRRAKARHTMLREAIATLKMTREALGLRRFLQKNFPCYNAATGRIRISHLGKSGWRSKRCSTSCIAFLPSAIPF